LTQLSADYQEKPPFQYQESAYMDEGANSKDNVPAWKNGALFLFFSSVRGKMEEDLGKTLGA
jgi:hypothetical protein